MKKTYLKPEVDLIDLTSKENLMVTGNGYDYPTPPGGLKDDYWMDATSRNGFDIYDDDILWDE